MDPMSGCDIRLVFTLPPRENWFQYVRRVYETAINFPYITTLLSTFRLEIIQGTPGLYKYLLHFKILDIS